MATNSTLTIQQRVEQADAAQAAFTRACEERERVEREMQADRILAIFNAEYPDVIDMCKASGVTITAGLNKHRQDCLFFHYNNRKAEIQYGPPRTLWLDSTGWDADILWIARFLYKLLFEEA